MRRDLLLRHDRTVHAKDGGVPLASESRRRGGNAGVNKASSSSSPAQATKPSITIDPTTLEQIEASSDGMVDLQTAAMLMTDFQHKAAAAATGHAQDRTGSDPSFSPDRGSLLHEPSSVSYLSSNATLPQMPWDTLMSPIDTKHHSGAAASSSHEGGPSLASISMERNLSARDALAPSLHSFVDSLPVSGNSTPNALSPYPSMTGPVSPVNYRRSPGPSQALSSPKPPQVANDMERQMIVDRIQSADTLSSLPEGFELPSTASLNKYLSTYFNLYHHHLPFLHVGSFHPTKTSPPLLLAVLSIGALYAFERDDAFMLHVGSKVLVNQFLQQKDNFDSRKCPLWAMQSTLLNMAFESWSGDPKGLEWTCSIKSLLANVSSFFFFFLAENFFFLGSC